MENELLNAALGYIKHGFYVFPLKPKSKAPLTPNGFKDASNNREVIKAWWEKYPSANIGIATGEVSNLMVIDVDGEYPDTFPCIPKTATVKTKKGYHLYLKYPKGQMIKSRTKIDGHDVDVRANGGYIVAPPSIHPDGGCYEFID